MTVPLDDLITPLIAAPHFLVVEDGECAVLVVGGVAREILYPGTHNPFNGLPLVRRLRVMRFRFRQVTYEATIEGVHLADGAVISVTVSALVELNLRPDQLIAAFQQYDFDKINLVTLIQDEFGHRVQELFATMTYEVVRRRAFSVPSLTALSNAGYGVHFLNIRNIVSVAPSTNSHFEALLQQRLDAERDRRKREYEAEVARDQSTLTAELRRAELLALLEQSQVTGLPLQVLSPEIGAQTLALANAVLKAVQESNGAVLEVHKELQRNLPGWAEIARASGIDPANLIENYLKSLPAVTVTDIERLFHSSPPSTAPAKFRPVIDATARPVGELFRASGSSKRDEHLRHGVSDVAESYGGVSAGGHPTTQEWILPRRLMKVPAVTEALGHLGLNDAVVGSCVCEMDDPKGKIRRLYLVCSDVGFVGVRIRSHENMLGGAVEADDIVLLAYAVDSKTLLREWSKTLLRSDLRDIDATVDTAGRVRVVADVTSVVTGKDTMEFIAPFRALTGAADVQLLLRS